MIMVDSPVWVDHLLASARLKVGGSLWTRDKRLQTVANRLGVSAVLCG
jgi:hypothetical protein